MITDNTKVHTQIYWVFVTMVTSSLGMVEHRSFSQVHSSVTRRKWSDFSQSKDATFFERGFCPSEEGLLAVESALII